MSREVAFSDLLVTIAQSTHGGQWRWQADDATGEVCCSTWGRAELRGVKKDLELLLGCQLENIRDGQRIVGYRAAGRTNTRIEVER